MSSLLPVAVYGLEVPAGDIIIPAVPDFPATFRITMAAIDPSAPAEVDAAVNGSVPARATLKIIRQPPGMDEDDEDSDEDSEDDNYLQALLGGADSDEEDEDEDEDESEDEDEKNGGPSDPSKSKKARKEAAFEQIIKALKEDGDDEMDVDAPNGINGAVSKRSKGKARATEEEDEDEDSNDGEDLELEEFVICTLDPTKNYQQPLDITIGEDERVFFKVTGTHTIYLTGNYVIPPDDGHNHQHEVYDSDEEEEGYDLSPDEDELNDEEESDDLDALDDPKITEVESEEEAPKLIKTDKKGKNKRAADDSDNEPASLDDIMAKSLKPAETTSNGEPKLSKKQMKKLKNNAGEAVASAVENKAVKRDEKAGKDSPATAKGDKKVQFAKNLEQGPSGTPKEVKAEVKADAKPTDTKKDEKPKASLGVKTVQGVKIDDKKLGTGPAAKKGDKVGMRYIGKHQDGKVFDANKKGKPFSFKLGSGEVIKGWDIGVAGMSVGGERRMTIPGNLAYGSKPPPGFPKDATLTFDVKLLEIK
ncbi:MAG: peptidylprolyl isomerase fpr4 [Pycnora praestabilis]|nr:MAG: peptidylprolyl isomerase fpr4 [Pycnora praestabilis]